jgi:predicted 2-oxoglutarate/Fe(II)-dependent dioxygenase YbiX
VTRINPRTIATIHAILSPVECRDHITRSEQIGYGPAPFADSIDERIRNNERVIIDDESLSALVWSRIRAHVPELLDGREATGVNERFRYYRYRPGQKFALHRDGFFRRENGEESKLTCLLYLNDDFTGGETKVKDVMIEPRPGMALIFRHEFPHEGRPVLDGTKYTLRTDVMYDRIGRRRG